MDKYIKHLKLVVREKHNFRRDTREAGYLRQELPVTKRYLISRLKAQKKLRRDCVMSPRLMDVLQPRVQVQSVIAKRVN